MLAAGEQIYRRARQGIGDTPQQVGEVPVERYVAFRGYGTSESQGNRPGSRSRPGATCCPCRPVRHRPVKVYLTIEGASGQCSVYGAADVRDGPAAPEAPVPLRIAIPELDRLAAPVDAPEGADATPRAPPLELAERPYGRAAATVQYLDARHAGYLRHVPITSPRSPRPTPGTLSDGYARRASTASLWRASSPSSRYSSGAPATRANRHPKCGDSPVLLASTQGRRRPLPYTTSKVAPSAKGFVSW
jgi:hypothetical protein